MESYLESGKMRPAARNRRLLRRRDSTCYDEKTWVKINRSITVAGDVPRDISAIGALAMWVLNMAPTKEAVGISASV